MTWGFTELVRIKEIDRSEHITQMYQSRDGVLEVFEVDIHAPRRGEPPECPLQGYVDGWYTLIENGGTLFGAFDSDRLVGFAIYDRLFCGEPAKLARIVITTGPFHGHGWYGFSADAALAAIVDGVL